MEPLIGPEAPASNTMLAQDLEVSHATEVTQEKVDTAKDIGMQANERQTFFRFDDLPAEIRLKIYKYLVPHSLIITSFEDTDHKGHRIWTIKVQEKGREEVSYELGGTFWYRGGYGEAQKYQDFSKRGPHGIAGFYMPRIANADGTFKEEWYNKKYPKGMSKVFYVNKAISNEARAILYGSNIFKFTIDGAIHVPISLQSPKIFGFLCTDGITKRFHRPSRLPQIFQEIPDLLPDRLHLLRSLRRIHIETSFDKNLDLTYCWTVKRLRARLQFFVEMLKQHADDESKKSLLVNLWVEVKPTLESSHTFDMASGADTINSTPVDPGDHKEAIFSLESLVSLRGVNNVRVTGVPAWYAKCLQLCIQGHGGDIHELNWPLVNKIQAHATEEGRYVELQVSGRKWYQPMFNWKVFADRNGISVPSELDAFWKVGSVVAAEQDG